ncbi:hypothetical protein B484DRAFT_399504 [Ochromonadaceae sp. CCMP2298]|nr:hypothetical protein B484DRAFT_399504 [Ochromonadaceae sp. CCMP2298]
MGNDPAIRLLVSQHSLSLEQAALRILSQPEWDREEADYPGVESSCTMPPLASWRFADPVGLFLDASSPLIVRSNFFRVAPEAIPPTIEQYTLSIFLYEDLSIYGGGGEGGGGGGERGQGGQVIGTEDLCSRADRRNSQHLQRVLVENRHWEGLGFAYDGAATVYTTGKLTDAGAGAGAGAGVGMEGGLLTDPTATTGSTTSNEQPFRFQKDIPPNGPKGRRFKLVLSHVSTLHLPTTAQGWAQTPPDQQQRVQALNVAMYTFAQWVQKDQESNWLALPRSHRLVHIGGSAVSLTGSGSGSRGSGSGSGSGSVGSVLLRSLVCFTAYQASLKTCISGLALVKDITVMPFLRGGGLLDLLVLALNLRNRGELERRFYSDGGLLRGSEDATSRCLEDLLLKARVSAKHLSLIKPIKGFGLAANTASFEYEGETLTVEQYYLKRYGISLEYPSLPTVDLGKGMLFPLEQLELLGGQARRKATHPDVTAAVMAMAAKRPQERFQALQRSPFFAALGADPDAGRFGLGGVGLAVGAPSSTSGATPMRVCASILPPAILQYAPPSDRRHSHDGRVRPELEGSWNLSSGVRLAHPAPLPSPSQPPQHPQHPPSHQLSQHAPASTSTPAYPYGIIFYHSEDFDYSLVQREMRLFKSNMETEGGKLGLPLRCVHGDELIPVRAEGGGGGGGREKGSDRDSRGGDRDSSGDRDRGGRDSWHSGDRGGRDGDKDLQHYFRLFAKECRLVLVVLQRPDACYYNSIKATADPLLLPSQCVKWDTLVSKKKSRFEIGLILKINPKMGGVNCTLAGRAPPSAPAAPPARGVSASVDSEVEVFQNPPLSTIPQLNALTMLMGIDVSHPTPGSGESSVLGVVGSVDGMWGQYRGYACVCKPGVEPVIELGEAVFELLTAFAEANGGSTPRHIIVYRDGVSDGQFDLTVQTELAAIEDALDLKGYPQGSVKIAFIVCQKRHHTRLVFQHAGERGEYQNPCVGLCVDARGFEQEAGAGAAAGIGAGTGAGAITGIDGSGRGGGRGDRGRDPGLQTYCIVGANLCEFYLTSAAAILGTSKPARYILLYDSIGLTLSEIQLLTFWLCHLYCRSTRSVSLATPAYYAHHLAKRGRALLQAGKSAKELGDMSKAWIKGPKGMYFV